MARSTMTDVADMVI